MVWATSFLRPSCHPHPRNRESSVRQPVAERGSVAKMSELLRIDIGDFHYTRDALAYAKKTAMCEMVWFFISKPFCTASRETAMIIRNNVRLVSAFEADCGSALLSKQSPDRSSAVAISESGKTDPVLAASTKASSGEVRREEVEAAADRLQDFFTPRSRELKFSVHENTGRIVVEVTDSATDTVVRQFPSEEILKLAEFFDEMQATGLLINGTV
jgi:flagellar protein FlaG